MDGSGITHSQDSSGSLPPALPHRQIVPDHSIQSLASSSEQYSSESIDSEGSTQSHSVQFAEDDQSSDSRTVTDPPIQSSGSFSEQHSSEPMDSENDQYSGTVQFTENDQYSGSRTVTDQSVQASGSFSEQDSPESSESELSIETRMLLDELVQIPKAAANPSHTQCQVVTDHSWGLSSEENSSESTDSEDARMQITEHAESVGSSRSPMIVEIEDQETGSEQGFSGGDESGDSRGAIPVQTMEAQEFQEPFYYSRNSRLAILADAAMLVIERERDESVGRGSVRIVEVGEEETGSDESQNRGNFPEPRNQFTERIWRHNRSMQMIEGAELRHVTPQPDFGAFVEYISNRKIRPCPAGARMYGVFQFRHFERITVANLRKIPRAGERIRFKLLDGARWLWLMDLYIKSPGQIAVEMEASGPQTQLHLISFEDQVRLKNCKYKELLPSLLGCFCRTP